MAEAPVASCTGCNEIVTRTALLCGIRVYYCTATATIDESMVEADLLNLARDASNASQKGGRKFQPPHYDIRFFGSSSPIKSDVLVEISEDDGLIFGGQTLVQRVGEYLARQMPGVGIFVRFSSRDKVCTQHFASTQE